MVISCLGLLVLTLELHPCVVDLLRAMAAELPIEKMQAK